MEIADGEMLAIIGASGSGKSTLLNIMGLLDAPDAGRVFYDGQTIHDAEERVQAKIRNQHFGFVFQAFNLLSHLSAIDNVGLPLLYRGLSKSDRSSQVQRLVVTFLPSKSSRPDKGLSLDAALSFPRRAFTTASFRLFTPLIPLCLAAAANSGVLQ
jgi:ABC-type lipoprotein export system ATPase subunit